MRHRIAFALVVTLVGLFALSAPAAAKIKNQGFSPLRALAGGDAVVFRSTGFGLPDQLVHTPAPAGFGVIRPGDPGNDYPRPYVDPSGLWRAGLVEAFWDVYDAGGGLTGVVANVYCGDGFVAFEGQPWEIRAGITGSNFKTTGQPVNFDAWPTINFGGIDWPLGYAPDGNWEVNRTLDGPQGSRLEVNWIAQPGGVTTLTGMHLMVPGVGEAWWGEIKIP